MPCYTERTVTVELSVADPTMLVQALTAAGYEVRDSYGALVCREPVTGRAFTIDDGQIEMTGASVSRAEALKVAEGVKRTYAIEGTKILAKRHGFTMKQDARSGQITLTRRSF